MRKYNTDIKEDKDPLKISIRVQNAGHEQIRKKSN